MGGEAAHPRRPRFFELPDGAATAVGASERIPQQQSPLLAASWIQPVAANDSDERDGTLDTDVVGLNAPRIPCEAPLRLT